jgi:hypothetical protein
LRCRGFEQHLQLLVHSPFLGGRCLRTTAQQHGCGGEVLRRLPEERWGITVGVGVDVRTLVGASVIVTRTSSGQRCRGAGSRLFDSKTTFLSLVVPLTRLFLHRDHLWGRQWCGLPVAGLWVVPQLSVKVGQLFVEPAPSFRELIESCPLLGVGRAVTRRWLRVGAARGQGHTDVVFACGVARLCGHVLRVVAEREAALVAHRLLT